MRTRHARRIRVGIQLARFEHARAWRVRVDSTDPLVERALARERRRLMPSTGTTRFSDDAALTLSSPFPFLSPGTTEEKRESPIMPRIERG